MANATTELKLQVHRKNFMRAVVAKQYDQSAHFLKIHFMDGEKEIIIGSGEAIINAMRADGTSQSFAGTVNSDNTVTVPIANWMLEIDDMVQCDVSIVSGSSKLTTACFLIEVESASNPDGEISEDDPNYDILIDLISDVDEALDKMYNTFPEKSASGNIAIFYDGSNNIPMKSVIAHIEPAQSGSGDPSPSNVRPISGWTGVNLYKYGENLAKNVAFTGGYYNDSGVITSSTAMKHEEEYLPVTAGKNYFVQFEGSVGSSQRIRVHEYSAGQQWLRQVVMSDGGAKYVSWTASNDAAYVRFSLVSGAVADSIICARGDKYSIDFPESAGTVYGGYVDVTKGKLIVTYKTFTINENTSFTDRISNQNRIYFVMSDMTDAYGGVEDSSTVCNILPKAQSVSGATTPSITIGNTNNYCYVNGISAIDTSLTDAATFKTWLASHNIIFTYRLATPLEYDLTPTEITSLLGYNAVYNDAGSTDVIYRADVGMTVNSKTDLIEGIIANVETSATATRNYSVGDLLILNDILYKVTSAITAGETITPETNVTTTTVEAEINALDSTVEGELSDLRNELNWRIDDFEYDAVTPNLNITLTGVTCEEENGLLKVYGTATAVRRYLFVNGQQSTATTSTSFRKTLDAGTYIFESDMTGAQTIYKIEGTYSTFANAFTIVDFNTKKTVVTFEQPVMIGFCSIADRNYGTSENPSYISLSIARLSTADFTARNEIGKLRSSIADVESSNTATKSHAVGSYLIYNDVLYKVTSAIASGDTIVPGTNVTATTIMQELLALA